MKIGELSKRCGISKDTIRYYISIGLLIPERKGSQYIFSIKDEIDAKEILHLKKMGFDLSEILNLLTEKRISNGIEPSYIERFLEKLEHHRSLFIEQIEQIKEAVDMIDNEIAYCATWHQSTEAETGVPLRALPYLSCPHCHGALSIEEALFTGKSIQKGHLSCKCGYGAAIERGVILTGHEYRESDDAPDLNRGLYQGFGQDFFQLYHMASKTCLNALQSCNLSGKVVLEANINGYFFLYQNLKELPSDNLYIITDKYPEMLYMYKELIEQINPKLDILYIADAITEYPLQKHCVDILIDFFGENEYQHYHSNTYIEAVQDIFAENVSIVGAYQSLRENAKSQMRYLGKYPRQSPDAMNFTRLEASMRTLGFQVQKKQLGSITKTRNTYSYSSHIDGEPMTFTCFVARKPFPTI